jgi:undecaprenyl-diphosphatase
MDFALARYCNVLGRGTIDGATELLCSVAFLLGLWGGLFALVFFRDRERGRLVAGGALVALVLHALITEGLVKHALGAFLGLRLRPYLAHPGDIACIGHPFADSSFPSSHAATTAALVTVLAFHYRRAWPVALVFALTMAFARVHNGLHYPTDVLIGTVLGLTYGVAAVGISRRWWSPRAASDDAPPT